MSLEKSNAYILPGLDKLSQRKLRIFFLPDGNERAKHKHSKDYSDGGKNVVRMIESLANRDDIDEVIFGLLSPENVLKRDRDKADLPFFEQLYTAFHKLGIAIGLEGKLVKSGIKLEVIGRLDRLRTRGRAANDLADIIEDVIEKTWTENEPKLVVKFGIDYPSDILITEGIDIVFRSGMEEERAFRSSGLELTPDIVCHAFTDLWPLLKPSQIDAAINRIKEDGCKVFSKGYNAQLLRTLDIPALVSVDNARIAAPYIGNLDKAVDELRKALYSDREINEKFLVKVCSGKNSYEVNSSSEKKPQVAFLTKEFEAGNLHWQSDFIVAPGQNSQSYRIPQYPSIGYASVFGTENSAFGINDAINRGYTFLGSNPRLIGASRIMPAIEVDTDSSFAEFTYLHKYAIAGEEFNKGKSLDDLVGVISKNKNPDSREKYNIMADLFVAKMIAWAESFGVAFSSPSQQRAFLNYCYVSFFMTYVPDHPEWDKISNGWQLRAEILAEYMIVVFLFDDRIYDLKMPKALKEAQISHATVSMLGALGLVAPDLSVVAVDDVTAETTDMLVRMQRDLSEKQLSGEKRWKKRYAGLVMSHYEEYFYREGLKSDNSEEADDTKLILMSLGIDSDMRDYLIGVEKSIGASMAYETVLACCDTENVPEELLAVFDDIFFLTNIYYRLVNDASEQFKNKKDREGGVNAVKIIRSRFINPERHGAMIDAEVEVLKIAARVKKLLDQKREAMTKLSGYPQLLPLIIAIIRSDFAELFYKDTHFKVAKRGEVGTFFDEKYWLGIK